MIAQLFDRKDLYMCGIVGFTGTSPNAIPAVVDGLSALEYRGYDSAGVCYQGEQSLEIIKRSGTVDGIAQQLSEAVRPQSTAIGHTRWATHGEPTGDNAHPHTNTAQTIAVVHNGIIENYQEIREFLAGNGYVFTSETDSEVIPHLIDYHLRAHKTFLDAFAKTLHELRGAYAIAAMCYANPGTIYAAKLSSPLVIGVGKTAHVLASDAMAVVPHTDQLIQLEDHEIAVLTAKTHRIIDGATHTDLDRQSKTFEHSLETADLAGYPDYMSKEIHQAADTVRTATRGRLRARGNIVKLGGLEIVSQQLRYIDRIVIVACGTSYYAGMVGEYLIEEIAGVPVEVQLASEFKYRHEPFSRSTALLAISQSGETADTIAALKKVEDYGVLRLGIVNAPGSTIAQMTDAGVYCHAGPEKSVASTKAFMAQVTVLAEIALHLSDGQSPLYKPLLQELLILPDKIEQVLHQEATIAAIAKRYAHHRDFLYIGRGELYPAALEGALKLKEISYIHAEGYAAGEMKHGPLAMIDAQFPTLALATNSTQLDKTISNVEEIRARKGKVIAVATEGNRTIKRLANDVIYLPDTLEQTAPLLAAVALQLFAYHVAKAKGLNVDRPRNLAKSVTVE